MAEKIEIKYTGRLADSGRLYFYEYSRSQYATARLVATIENFRRTGEVAQRISGNVQADILVEAPERGSFTEKLLVLVQEGAATAISAQFSALLALAWNAILPRSEKTDSDVLAIAEIRLKEEKEKTAQFREMRQIVDSGNATTQQALGLVAHALQSSNPALGHVDLTGRRLGEMQDELLSERQRNHDIEGARAALEQVDSRKLVRLSSRLRSIVPDIAKPLEKSADEVLVSANDSKAPTIRINRATVSEISEKYIEDDVVEMKVRLRSYDRDRGVGKVSSPSLPRQLNILVPPDKMRGMRDLILEAMRREEVTISCRRVLDKSGLPTSLILEHVDL